MEYAPRERGGIGQAARLAGTLPADRPLNAAGLRYSIGLSLHRTASVDYQLGFARGAAAGPFTVEQQQLLDALTGPLMHTVRFAEQWRQLKLQAALTEQGLASAGGIVLGLSPRGQVVYATDGAERLLRTGTPCRRQRGALALADPAAQARWPEVLRRALRRRHDDREDAAALDLREDRHVAAECARTARRSRAGGAWQRGHAAGRRGREPEARLSLDGRRAARRPARMQDTAGVFA